MFKIEYPDPIPVSNWKMTGGPLRLRRLGVRCTNPGPKIQEGHYYEIVEDYKVHNESVLIFWFTDGGFPYTETLPICIYTYLYIICTEYDLIKTFV